MVAARVGVAGAHVERELGGDDEPVAVTGDELAGPPLAGPVVVLVRGVEEIAPCPGVGVEDATGLDFVLAPSRLGAEGQGAEGEFRDAQAARAEQLVLHEYFSRIERTRLSPQPVNTARRCDNSTMIVGSDEQFMRAALAEAASA